jgi:long-chain fatty acid transport protein
MAKLKGSAYGYGAQVGLSGKLTDNLTLGVRVLSPVKFNYKNADATFTPVSTGLVLAANNPLGAPAGTPVDALLASQFTGNGALVAQKVSTTITNPAQAQVGFNYTGIQNWNFEADYAWIGWRSFKELPVTFTNPALNRTQIEDYNNSSAIRLSAEYTWKNNFKLRGGFSGVASAAPDETVTPLLPEQDREYANGGISIPLGNRWGVDAAYSHIFTQGRRGRIDERLDRSLTAAQLNTGVYNLSGNVFSLSLKAAY